MAIRLSYSCTCGLKTGMLDDAQAHANSLRNDPRHSVSVHGLITADEAAVANVVAIEEAAERRAREAEIMRLARDRNLLSKRGVR